MIGTIITFVRDSTAARIVLAGLAALLVVALLVRWVDRAQDHAVEQAAEAGRADQRAGDLQETIHRIEEAQDARDEIRNSAGSARYDECVRSAGATAANCQRFLPR
ncbi:hypothetical protein GCM10007897_15290 [Sphingobium jiangsuense]|uniref:Type II secretory pathway pseudopilin PulG n=1 Tax=Sphingobium jiangsuense TaxID=870476 RepID=A0A7W6BDQ6_9SPHN|nr:hypothetical protein [Sphingobium jiangsuense]MBB3925025.1 type II secretory pathway pseudopilin PulG [Sphingobium jiangsuense]GLT00145.1 hypothetical protein GCM10007897_15290 [Sphingobium jiangsuense]